jgi:hypothetical protein
LLLANGYQFLNRAWWYWLSPALNISLIVLALNVVGDGLRDALEARELGGYSAGLNRDRLIRSFRAQKGRFGRSRGAEDRELIVESVDVTQARVESHRGQRKHSSAFASVQTGVWE